MKSILSFVFRSFFAFNAAIVTWLVAFFGFDVSFWMSSFIAIIGGGITNYYLKVREQKKLLSYNQLSKKEFQYINQNVKEAHEKLKRLNKALLGIRTFNDAKLIGKLQRLSRQIYQIVKKEPKRFYQAEQFFFYHLDSVVELSERYVFLAKQNVADMEVRVSLAETEQTLGQLEKSLDDDLLTVLANDIETLNLELDVAKQTHERNKNLFPK